MVGTSIGYRYGGLAFSSQKPVVVKDYGQWEGRIDTELFKELRACVVIPLENQTGTIGLGRFGEDASEFSRMEVEMLKRFSNMASICIENAKIYSALQRELRQRQQAEKSLAVSKEEFDAIFESIQEGFYRTDAQGRVSAYELEMKKKMAGSSLYWRMPMSGMMMPGNTLAFRVKREIPLALEQSLDGLARGLPFPIQSWWISTRGKSALRVLLERAPALPSNCP